MNDTALLHPAIRVLLQAQVVARGRRLRRAFSTPRRLALSTLAAVLACVWLGNVVLSILFREPADPERFAQLLPIGFFVYAAWHLIKCTFARPEQGIEWTPAEQAWLVAGPLTRRDLLSYRFMGMLSSSLLKASCFAFLMLPDLRQPLAGFAGMLLALLFVDLWKMTIELTTHGMSRAVYRRFRWIVGALLAAFLLATLLVAFRSPRDWQSHASLLSLSLFMHILHSAEQLLATAPGQQFLAPFQLFSRCIVSGDANGVMGLNLLGSACLVGIGVKVVVLLDRHYAHAIAARERVEYSPIAIARAQQNNASRRPQAWGRVAWLAGAGPIAWRQWIGARKYRGSLAVAMALPGILTLLPIAFCRDGKQALVQVSATLTFYSFLLLPTALKFDFRRDILRMVALKSLPIHPVSLVVGQILTPTLLALAFQTVILLITMCIHPYPVWMLVATLALLGPLDALIFAIDNLVFLLYPYRLNQEGLEVFLRTTLTFTAKGLIFATGLFATFLWSFAAHQIARWLPGLLHDPALVFVIGGTIQLMACTAGAIVLLARTYVRFDPSQDTPA